jgi:hypothetical protein
MNTPSNDEILKTIKRLETRTLRGFNMLGLDVLADPEWLQVTGDTITITSLSHSLAAIMKRGKERGAAIGERPIAVKFQGSVVCILKANNHAEN